MSGFGRFELDRRRTAPPGPLPTDSEPTLIALIRAEIGVGGPMTFARFMAIALYDPDHGYYRVASDRPVWSGDFLTAPETHPLFGAAVGRQLDEVWRRLDRPARFVLREYGAGSGTLAAAILAELRADGSGLADALVYDPVEINEFRQADAGNRAGLKLRSGLDSPVDPAADGVARFEGAVLANEFLDALPVHLVAWQGGRLRERYIDWDEAAGGLVERTGEPSDPALAERLASDRVDLAEGQLAEVGLLVEPWLAEVADVLERGLVIVLDYGHPAATLYDPARVGGSLRAYAGHRAHADPLIAVGRQDLTSHVDLTALEAGATAHGLALLGNVTQAEFLLGCGLEELVERIRSDPATTIDGWLAARSAVARFLDPAALGGFRAVLLGRAIEAPLLGLQPVRHSPY